MAGTRPNLLLITTDQQRYDAMGLNGNPHLPRSRGFLPVAPATHTRPHPDGPRPAAER